MAEIEVDKMLKNAIKGGKINIAAGSIGLGIITPVIYTGGAGGGANEYPAPPGGATYKLDASVPAGSKIIASWYTVLQAGGPIDYHLGGFNLIDVTKVSDTEINLSLIGIAGTNMRIRLKIYSLFG